MKWFRHSHRSEFMLRRRGDERRGQVDSLVGRKVQELGDRKNGDFSLASRVTAQGEEK